LACLDDGRKTLSSYSTQEQLMSFKYALFIFLLLVASVVLSTSSKAQQVADTLFNPKVGTPAFIEGTGPTVLIDEGHFNFHTMNGRYLPFARLLQKDGYIVKPLCGKFTRPGLDGAKILVVSNALAKENEDDWILPTPSAFDSGEVETVRNWVQGGGSLWLIADHMPFAGAAESLAAEFGILMGNGFALDRAALDGRICFSRPAGTLATDPITEGRNPSERIDSVTAFTGQAFRLEGDGEGVMTLGHDVVLLMPEVAWQFSKLTPSVSASRMLQGAVMKVGKGRVAVFGEAAMFSAQVAGPNRIPAGMNDSRAPQNAQFLLNVVHWLSGLL
jgi:hypothetical protein